ncbi:hypothetical protein B0H11DRAFT_1815289 [Mycena galericulata]|nr:hypothetical protein B0H11DRAFT_1815289 [Mycena galericulata]
MSHQPTVPEDSQDTLNHIEGCHCTQPTGRNIIICIDGAFTGSILQLTSVLKLYKDIDKADRQVAYYHNGIAPLQSPFWKRWKRTVNDAMGLAIGWDSAHTIQAAYIWLSNNYQNGDRIYFFGFARGAYEVRVLSGIVATLGLVFPNNESQVPIAYDLYTSLRSKTPDAGRNLIKLFRETFARNHVRVHFVGVWETLPSGGIYTPDFGPLPGDVADMCFFRHGLALDERRGLLLPKYAIGAAPERSGGTDASSRRCHTDVKEVWFAGTHFDLGESNVHYPLGAIPFHWMYTEARRSGLRLPPLAKPPLDPQRLLPREHLTGIWWCYELLPIKRPTYKNTETTYFPHLGHGRVMLPGQKIHASVHSLHPGYVPRAVGARVKIQERATDDGWEMQID